jgi:aryl-alcohol dehydrogenase-like predicted oxidoreductase
VKYIELCGRIHSSVLGFGCAPILGAVDRMTATRALTVALDEGINYFDLAPSYGYGEAQELVGSFLAGRKHQVVIASKFGIEARRLARVLRPVKPLIRAVKHAIHRSRTPSPVDHTRTRVPIAGDLLHRRVPLSGASMIHAVEGSLRALRRDYLDLLLVHEPAERLDRLHELREVAAKLKQEGKLRAWGLALPYSSRDVHADYLDQFDAFQTDNSPGAAQYSTLVRTRQQDANIFFSPFRSAESGASSMPHSAILAQMTTDFPRSVVLCSMFREAHIRENARACAGGTRDQLSRL